MRAITSYQNWQNGRNEFLSATGVTALAIFVVLTIAADFWVGLAGGLAAIAVMDVAYKPFKRAAVYKFFLTTWPVAAQIVENVLQAKGLPCHRVADKFTIANDLTILVKTGVYGKNGPRGVFVSIGPYNEDNAPLIHSLQKKLDAAFAPQGIKTEHETTIFNL